MTKPRKNLKDKIFGKLKVICQVEDYIHKNGTHRTRWRCLCECGNTIVVLQDNLISGKTKSCGCIRIGNAKSLGFSKHRVNKYLLKNDYGIGFSNNTNEEFYFDLEDYDKIKDICWSVHILKNGLKKLEGRNRLTGKNVTFHEMLGYKKCDHIDRNELNNRKSNLRRCTQAENSRNRSIHKNNSSGYIGVSWNKKSQKWISYIMYDGKYITLGFFENKEQAIIARLQAEKMYYKEFAPQRHLFEQINI